MKSGLLNLVVRVLRSVVERVRGRGYLVGDAQIAWSRGLGQLSVAFGLGTGWVAFVYSRVYGDEGIYKIIIQS